MPERPCSTCGIVKPLSEFPIQRTRPDGHRCQCKACHNARERIRYQTLPSIPDPEPDLIRAVRLPRRRYAACPKCGSRALFRDEDGARWCICGWSEPLYRAVESAQYAMA